MRPNPPLATRMSRRSRSIKVRGRQLRAHIEPIPCRYFLRSHVNEVFGIRPALQHPNVTLLTRARAMTGILAGARTAEKEAAEQSASKRGPGRSTR